MKLKKFETREQITTAIDKVHMAFKSRSDMAAEHGLKATECFAQSAKEKNPSDIGTLVKQGQYHRSQERKYMRQNKRVPKQLEALKNTLAAFDTDIMAFETSRAVVLQR